MDVSNKDLHDYRVLTTPKHQPTLAGQTAKKEAFWYNQFSTVTVCQQ